VSNYRVKPDILDYAQTTRLYLAHETQVPAVFVLRFAYFVFGLIMKSDNRVDAGWCPISFFGVLIEKFYGAVESAMR
jgi:hypothetical protein